MSADASPTSLELLLVRHGSTYLNERQRFQGRIDPPLSTRGRREAQEAGRALALGGRRVRLWSSARRRARETAELLGAGSPTVDPRIAELDFGLFEGCTWEEAKALAPRALEAWLEDPWSVPPPGGERVDELVERVSGWLAELGARGRTAEPRGGPRSAVHVAVTHAGPVAACLQVLLKRPWREAFDARPAPGGIVRLILRSQGWALRPPGER